MHRWSEDGGSTAILEIEAGVAVDDENVGDEPMEATTDEAVEELGKALKLYLELFDAGKLEFVSSEERLQDIREGIANSETFQKNLVTRFPQLSL